MPYTTADQLIRDLEDAFRTGKATCVVHVKAPEGKGFTLESVLRLSRLRLVQYTTDVGPLLDKERQRTTETVIRITSSNFAVEAIRNGFHAWIQAALQVGSTVEMKK